LDTNKIEQLVKAVAAKQLGLELKSNHSLTVKDYPLAQKRPDLIKSPTGKSLNDITLEKVMNEEISAHDLRISSEVLKMQAAIAEDNGKVQLAENLRRASEMTRIPDEKVLEIYNLLRPKRATKQELLDIADELESLYEAKRTAALIRQAAEVYEKRDILK